MTDFHALCVDLARVADALDGRTPLTSNQGQALDGYSALAEFRHVADRARAALAAEADGPAVPEGREPASVDDSLALRVQRLESMRETEKAALLDAFRQIDDLKHRIDFQYFKLCRLEDAIAAELESSNG